MAGPRIMGLSGDQPTIHTLRKNLEECGCTWLGWIAQDENSLTAVQNAMPDAVLVDLRRDEQASIQTAMLLRQNSLAAIIALFATEEVDLSNKMRQSGAHGFVRWPAAGPDLQAVIETALHFREIESQNASIVNYPGINPHPVMQVSQDGMLLFANRASQPLLNCCGCSIGRPIPEEFRQFVRECLNSQSIVQTEKPCGEFIYLLSWVPVNLNNAVNIYGIDITQRKQAENALQESEEKFRSLAESTSAAILIFQGEGCLYANPAAEKLTGYTRLELTKLSYFDLIPPDFHPLVSQIADEYITGRKSPEHTILRLVAKDGSQPWVELTGDFLEYQGMPAGVVTLINITERIASEQAQKETEIRFQHIIESTPVGMHMYRMDGENRLIFIGANPAADAILGIDHRTLVGKTIEEAFPGLVNTPIPETYKQIAANGGTWQNDQVEYDERRIKGAFEVHAYQSGLHQATISFIDITERKRASEELARRARELDELYQTSLEINNLSDMPKLLNAIVRRAADLVGAPMGGLYLMSSDRNSVILAVSYNLPGEYLGTRLALGEGLSGKVAQTGMSIMVEDYRFWEGHAKAFLDTPFRRVLGVPLKVGQDIIGVINITDTVNTQPFSSDEIRLVTLFADQAAIAVANARLYETVQHELVERRRAEAALARQAREMNELYATSLEINTLSDVPKLMQAIVNRAANLLGVKVGGLYLMAADGQAMTLEVALNMPEDFIGLQMKLGEGLAGKVAETGHLLAVDDYQNWEGRSKIYEGGIYHRAIAIPLKTGEDLLGVFFMTDTECTGSFNEKEIRLVSLFADQAAIALSNARLITQVQSELGERKKAESALQEQLNFFQLLTDISTQFINPLSGDVRTQIHYSLERLGQFIGADRCSLQEYNPANAEFQLINAWEKEDLTGTYVSGRISDFPGVSAIIQRGDMLLFTNPSEFPAAELPEMAFFKQTGIQAMLLLPLRLEGELFGALCFARYQQNCNWNKELAQRLSLVGEILTNALARRRSEIALLASEERYRQVSELTSDFAYSITITEDGNYEPDWATEAAYRVIGFTPEDYDAQSQWFYRLIHPDDLGLVEEQAQKLLAGETISGDVRIITKDKAVRWLGNYTRPVWDETHKRVTHLIGAARDVTSQKLADQALRDQLRFQQFLAEISSSIIRQPTGQLDDQIVKGLELLANYLEVDRCTVQEYFNESHSSVPLYTWGREGTPDAIPITEESPLELIIHTIENLQNFQFSCLDEAVEHQDLFAQLGIKSLLVAPLDINGAHYGLVCVSYQQGRKWPKELIQQLQLVVEIFANALSRQQAMAEVHNSEIRYRRLVEMAPYGVFVQSGGIITFANETAFRLFRAEYENQIIGTHMIDFVLPDDQEIVQQHMHQLLSGQDVPTMEKQFLRVDGSVMDVEITALALTYQGEPAALVMMQDITDRKQSAQALARRAEELAALQATLLDITTPNNLPTVLQTIVERAVDLLDAPSGALYLCEPEQKRVRCVVSYKTKQDYTHVTLAYGEGAGGMVASTGKSLIIDDYRTWEGRSEIFEQEQPFISVLAVPMVWHGGVTGVIIVLDDTQVRRFSAAEEELINLFANHAAIAVENTRLYEEALSEEQNVRNSEERFRSAFEDAPVGMTLTSLDGRYMRANRTFCQMIGYSEEEIIQINFRQITHPDDREANESMFQNILSGVYNSFSIEKRYLHKNGNTVWATITTSILKNAEGKPLYFITHISDTSQQKMAEQAEHARIERIQRQQQTLIRLATRQSVQTNNLAATYQDITQSTAIVMNVERASIWLFIENEKKLECVDVYRKSSDQHGSEEPVEMTQYPTYFNHIYKERVIAAHDAIHDERTREFADEFLTPLSVTSMLDAGIRVSGRLVGAISLDHIGPARTWTEDEIAFAGEIADQVAQVILNQKRQSVERELRESEARLIQMADTVNEVFWIFDLGKQDLVFVSAAYEEIFQLPAKELFTNAVAWHKLVHPDDLPAAKAITDLHGQGIAGEDELRIIRPDGSLRWIRLRAFPVEDETGRPYRLIGVAQDITEGKQREMEMGAVLRVSTVLRSAQSRSDIIRLILQQLMSLLNADNTMISIQNTSDASVEILQATGAWQKLIGKRIPAGDGVSGQVLSTGKPYITKNPKNRRPIPDNEIADSDLAVAVIPLITQQHAIGVLWVGRKADFTPAEIRLMQAIAEISANAIHRTDLHEQTQRHVERLSALHDVDIAISTNFDLNAILDILVEQVISQLEVDAADVLLYNPHSHQLEFVTGRGLNATINNRLRLRLNDSLAGRSVLERGMIIVPDLRSVDQYLVRYLAISDEKLMAYLSVPLMFKGHVKGVLEIFHHKPGPPEPEEIKFLESLANQAAIAIDNTQMFENLQRTNLELSVAYDATIEGWAHALELRDMETEGHSERVTEMTVQLAILMGLSAEEQIHLRRGALLHDIGKMGIPDSILRKPTSLSEEEWMVMRQHTVMAYRLLTPIDFLRPAAEIPYCHHEHWDGSGYPRGLAGEQIPISARVFTVIDVYDALTNKRPYRNAWSHEETIEYIRENRGLIFDPQVVDAFLTMIP